MSSVIFRKHRVFKETPDVIFYDINNTRREVLFIQLLESLHADEAEVLCLVKDKKLAKKYKISFPVVKEAYPDIRWGNRV